jgi:hypothetical protein
MHGEVTRGPGVRIESSRDSETLALVDQRQLVVKCASDCLRVEQLSRCEDISDSATELGILEVVPEVAADDVDGTLAVVGSDERRHCLDLDLLEIVKVVERLLAAVNLGCKGGCSSSERLLTIRIVHGTLNERWMNFYRCQLCSIQHAENAHVIAEALTSYLNELRWHVVFHADWAALRERSKIRIVAEDELVLCVVFAIEGEVDVDLVTSTPARRRCALHGLVVDEEGRHHAHWRIVLVHALSLGGSVWHLSEAAENTLHRIRNIRELGSSQPDLCSADDAAALGLDVGELRPLVVAELEASVLPVHSIQRHLDFLGVRNTLCSSR